MGSGPGAGLGQGQGPQGPMRQQPPMPSLGPDSPFNQEQMMLLRNQMIAYRALSKNAPIAQAMQAVQQALASNIRLQLPGQQPQQQQQQQTQQSQQPQQQQPQPQQQPQQQQQPQAQLQAQLGPGAAAQGSPNAAVLNHQRQPSVPVPDEFQNSPGRGFRKPAPSMSQRSFSRASSISSPVATPQTPASGAGTGPATGGTDPLLGVGGVSGQASAGLGNTPSPQPPMPVNLPPSVKLFGVSSYIDPRSPSYLAQSVSFEDYTARQQQLFIPTIMPVGLDVVDMKLERERRVQQAMHNRMAYLEEQESESSSGLSIDEKIELKSLRLANYNKALRGDILANVYYFNMVALDESNKGRYTRMKKLSLQEAIATEQFTYQQRVERQRRENQRKIDNIQSTVKHAVDVANSVTQKRSRLSRLQKSIVSFHAYTEKEEQKRLERTAKQRLQALRANDEEAYIKLLDQTKDTRITHLLRQTNTFLHSLTKAVESQQRENKGLATLNTELPDIQEGDEDSEVRDYYAVAHRIKEEITKQPSILVGGTLKEYQLKGLQWMVSLYNNSLNGILADEMGLGKTIQSISLITYLIEMKQLAGPFLVIVPLSTLTNWNLEFEKWAPSVKKVVYKGPPMARKAQQGIIRSGDFQVLLTTYEYIIKDRPILSRIKWAHMIIDEGHRMKNTQSKLSFTLTTYYSTRYRLILTGTPLQNNLPELWALLNFVLPKIFNSVKSFDEWFNTPFANTGGQDKMDLSEEETLLIIRRLHKVLRPFLLRRLKKDVEKDLPDKVEKVIKCKMSALQQKLYQQMIKYKLLILGDNVQGASASGLKGLNNQIMQLRKICNHPFVFEEVENLVNPNKETNDDLFRAAGKFELLDRILPKFKKTGHRVLIFFQMTQIMDIMEDYLRLRDMQYLRLDGSTKAEDRSDLLKKFNAPDSPYFAFLLSTRAGGLGLNLQTADTVIIYDTDWNPHQDLQAQDRAHRIGQTKEVRILRLITEDSVEEHILEKAHRKLEIDGKVIQAGKFDNKSTNEEQEAFLRSLLEAEEAKKGHKDDDDEEMDDEELNEVLARDDNEKEIFREIDRIRAADYGKSGARARLITEDELPDIYKQDVSHLVKPEPMENYGRGTRERKVLHYDDGLTEEQWLEAVDNDDDTIEDAIARKRQRINKRQQNKLRDREEDSADVSSPGTPLAGGDFAVSTPGTNGKRKRGRKARDTTASVSASATGNVGTPTAKDESPASAIILPVRKRAKGRPPKVKETLSPQARRQLTEQMEEIFNFVTTQVKDDDERNRIDLFLERPPKRIYPDYYLLIENPIACDIIRKRINDAYYQSLPQFREDFRLMFRNARTYNEEGSFVVQDANILENMVNTLYYKYIPEAEAIDKAEAERVLQEKLKKEETAKLMKSEVTQTTVSDATTVSGGNAGVTSTSVGESTSKVELMKLPLSSLANEQEPKQVFKASDSESDHDKAHLSPRLKETSSSSTSPLENGSIAGGAIKDSARISPGIHSGNSSDGGSAASQLGPGEDGDDENMDGGDNSLLVSGQQSAVDGSTVQGDEDEDDDALMHDHDGLELDPFGGDFNDYGNDFDNSNLLDRLN
ncbi:SWI/SNF catalytic subunit SNF2 [Sugiyamaella lignohabitans]|uniref:SWI/SNF catalytic subunit SNF2 n=1 Tax=Sugiyamaella lignohabitans TaxID=796027 RepID=A0A167CPD8_9ASCO|nr:SWI/SNF catalytic subunit SNF2 [Sugiyamaella lignohabitans]ANB11950.1 SWI/SNF catalytic subunit SNF2 [Sugiyamaella lignohabitans]